MVSDNRLDQYFQVVKHMPLEEVISEPLIHPAYKAYINQKLEAYMMIAYTVSLYCLKAVRCCWLLVPCFSRAVHNFMIDLLETDGEV